MIESVMDEFEVVDASEAKINGRRRRWGQLYDLEVGKAMFIPDSALNSYSSDPMHGLQALCSYRHKTTGQRLRARKGEHKGQRGAWVIRES